VSALRTWTHRGKKSDAYVICRVSKDVFQRSKTIDEGGSNPTWNGGKGEEMVFEVDAAETAGKIRLECMDDGTDEIVKKTGEIKEDEFIGVVVRAPAPLPRLICETLFSFGRNSSHCLQRNSGVAL
jgi:hypothetical protein